MKEIQPCKCEICDASFTQKRNLKTHMISVHEGKNHSNVTFAVKTLQKTIIQKDFLLQFMKERNHTNVTFVILTLLKNLHITSVHEKIKSR